MDKYTSDYKHEAFVDSHFFLPLADKVVNLIYNKNITPNQITLMSLIFQMIGVLLFYYNKKYLFLIFYIIGYFFDCIDGKLARKQKSTSDFGMIFDQLSDMFIFLLLIVALFKKYNFIPPITPLVIIMMMSYMLSLSFGLNDAMSNYAKYGNDNYYDTKFKKLEKKSLIYQAYLYTTKCNYNLYKNIMNEYSEDKANVLLKVLKEFGPGTFVIIISCLLYNY
jgi:phosphatidylglycerophosphate synthase